jgi:hypothetical protein
MKFVLLRSFDNYISAHIAMGRLKDSFVSCYLKDEYTVTIDPLLSNAIGGIKLMVAESQAERAVDILNSLNDDEGDNSTFPS